MNNSEEHAHSVFFTNDTPIGAIPNLRDPYPLNRYSVPYGSEHFSSYICRLWYKVIRKRFTYMNWRKQYLNLLGSNCCYNYSICNFSLAVFALLFLPILLATSQNDVGGLQKMSPSQKKESMGSVIFCITIYAVTIVTTSYVLIRRYYIEKAQVKQSIHKILFDLKKMKREKPNGLARHVYNALKISESRTMEDALEMSRISVEGEENPSNLHNKRLQTCTDGLSPRYDYVTCIMKNPNNKDLPYAPDTSRNSDVWDPSIAENIGDITFDPAQYGNLNGAMR